MAQDSVGQPLFLARYRKCFEASWTDDTAIDQVRFVVLDSETTGLNPNTDRIITIGAVSVQDGEIILSDSFEALIKLKRNTPAVTVHGITRDESLKGREETEVLELFLEYLKDGVIVGHHIGHDMASFDAAYNRHWGFSLLNRCVDTLSLALHLEKDGAFAGKPPIRNFSLDALCGMFDVVPYDRHTATGDAFITAQIFLRLRRLALRYGRSSLRGISEPFEE